MLSLAYSLINDLSMRLGRRGRGLLIPQRGVGALLRTLALLFDPSDSHLSQWL